MSAGGLAIVRQHEIIAVEGERYCIFSWSTRELNIVQVGCSDSMGPVSIFGGVLLTPVVLHMCKLTFYQRSLLGQYHRQCSCVLGSPTLVAP
jgi:hypothetical protein